MREALSRHAEEAYAELSPEQQPLAAKIFKALTEIGSSGRGVRRPATLGKLATITGAGPAAVAAVVEVFRAPGRSFLMPPAGQPLAADSTIDISHESLMRTWGRLAEWTRDEQGCGVLYRRLEQTAALAAARPGRPVA